MFALASFAPRRSGKATFLALWLIGTCVGESGGYGGDVMEWDGKVP